MRRALAAPFVLIACTRPPPQEAFERPHRVGGDEFVVLSIDATDHDLVAVTGRLALELDRVNRLSETAIALRWSVGFVAFEGTGVEGLDLLMSEADRRMYASKRGGRARTSTDPA